MSQLNKWMIGGKVSKLVVVITSKETGEHIERWQFDVQLLTSGKAASSSSSSKRKSSEQPTGSSGDKENAAPLSTEDNNNNSNNSASISTVVTPEKSEKEIHDEIQSIFRQITASVTFLPMLDGNCTFNVLVYADADSEVPMEWGDSDAKEIKNGEKVQLRSFSTSNHRVDTLVSYRYV